MQKDEAEIDELAIFKVMAKWHPSAKKLEKLALIELEFKCLKEAVVGRSKHGQWQGLRRRVDFAQEQCLTLLEQAQTYLRDLQRSLMATERQCNKRIQNIERDCLHRDIQIQTMLDQQILQIVQENRILQMGDEEILPFLRGCSEIQERINAQRAAREEVKREWKIRIEYMRSRSLRRMKQIGKAHQLKMQALRAKMDQLQLDYGRKVEQLRERREKFENVVLQHIHKKIAQQ